VRVDRYGGFEERQRGLEAGRKHELERLLRGEKREVVAEGHYFYVLLYFYIYFI
jgi:hypothetical protein